MVQRHLPDPRVRLFVPADADPRDLQFQRQQTGDGMGGIFHPVVRRADPERSLPRRRMGDPEGGGDVLHLGDIAGNDGGLCSGTRWAFSGAYVVLGNDLRPACHAGGHYRTVAAAALYRDRSGQGRPDHRSGSYDVFHVLCLRRRILAARFLRSLAGRSCAGSGMFGVGCLPARDPADHRACRHRGLAAGFHAQSR